MNSRPALLIVDGDRATCDRLSKRLADEGYDCYSATTVKQAIDRLKRATFDMALLDIDISAGLGMDLVEIILRSYRQTAVIINTSLTDTDTAVQAMKRGAVDYIVKPCSMEIVIARLGVALSRKSMPLRTTRIADENQAGNATFRTLDAVARGVEAQVSRFDSHWKTVIDRTVETARVLGFLERQINEWAAKRRAALVTRERDMEWGVGRFGYGEQSPLIEMVDFPESETTTGEQGA